MTSSAGGPMVVGDEHVAALRAVLTNDAEGYGRVVAGFAVADDEAYGKLLAAAFCDAVQRRFGRDRILGEMLRFVASVRGRSPETADVQPRNAEALIRAALGDRAAMAGLDDALTHARTRADRMMTDTS